MKTKSKPITPLFSWRRAGILSGLAYRLVRSSVPAPSNRLHRTMLLLVRGQRRRFWLGAALLVLAGLPSAGHTAGLVTAWGDNSSGQTNVPPNLTNVVAIAAGYDFSLALKADGTVVGWGDNASNQITVPSGLSNVVAIAAGYQFSLALKADGTLAAWGGNSAQNRVAGLSNVLAIAAGWYHGLALRTDGSVVGRGENSFGQITAPAGLSNVVAIAAGYDFSLALQADGTVVGCGDNADGETNVPPNLTNVVAIAAGSKFGLALKADGTVAAWGDNTHGQTTVPAGLTNVAAMAGGGSHSLVLVNGAGPPEVKVIALWQNLDSYFHDTKPIAWLTRGFDPATFTAQILAARAGNTYLVGSSTNVIGSLNWNTATVPNGVYQLEGLFSANSPQIARELFQTVLVNNSASWHSGVVTTNETWAAGTVHVVEGNLELASGVVVTIQAGAVVKFAPGAGITVDDAATLDASAATGNAPIVFTSLADDSAAGDTNLDGDSSRPEAGDWTGITLVGSGRFDQGPGVEIRYSAQTHRGTLSASQTWLGGCLHLVAGPVVVPAGATLTINPGAVLKFAAGVNLTVQTGGTLMAQGTVAMPITFTSIKDDSVAGDSNGDGAATTPAAGDWDSIYISGGNAIFDHVVVTYGASANLPAGLITSTDSGSVVSVANSVLSHGLYVGLQGGAGTVSASNSVVTECDRGIQAGSLGHASVTVVNCTLDANNIGMFFHGGTVNVANTIVADSLTSGIADCCGSTVASFRYCDVWSATGTYGSSTWPFPNQTGQNGNISADPNFKNAAQGDYQLNYLSPCIDAADSTIAPATDFMGAPRYNDPRTLVKTGIPTNGVYADMGAFEFVETASSDIDLLATDVAGPSAVIAGQTATVTWNDVNLGSGSAVGPWHDTISLAPMDGSSNVLWTSEVLVGQGEVLGPGESYAVSATVTVPGGPEANYQWQVHVNNRGEIFEGANWTNNVALADAPASLTVPSLTVGGVLQTGEFSTNGQTDAFKITPANGQTVLLTLEGAFTGSALMLYVGQGYMPGPNQFDFKSSQFNASSVSVQIGNANGGVYYVAAYALSLGTSTEPYTLGAAVPVFGLNSIGQGTIANDGAVTIQIDGALLAAGDTYQLLGPGGTFTATTVQVSDPTTAYATFNLNGAATGNYTLQVTDQNGSRYSLPAAVNVVPASAGRLSVQLEAPANFRVGRVFDAQVVYGNVGNVDMPAPILILSAGGQAALRLLPTDSFSTNDLQVIGASLQGPAGVLRPGQTWSIPCSVLCSEDISIPLAVDYKSADATDAVDYVELAANLRLPGYSDSDWDALWTSFQSAAGPTWGGLVKLMAQYATIMAQENDLGEEVGSFYSFDDVLAYALAHSLEQAHTSVAGTLYLNDTNHPLAQTYVYLSNADGSQGGADMTNPDGVFRLLSLTNNTYTVAVAGYWLPQPVQVTVPASGSVTGLTVIVRQGGSIAGVVRDQAGATLLTNVSVQAVSQSTNGEFAATTGSDGSFLLSGLPPDIYDLTVGGDPFVAQTVNGVVLSDGQILTTNFYLAPGASVQGTVAANGAPATNAAVTLWTASGGVAASAVTDTNGNFSLLGLAAGDYTLEVRAGGYADFTTNAHIEAGETLQQAPVSLLPGATISVIQHFGASQVVTNGIASLYQDGNLVTQQFADTNGFAVFSGLAAGQYTLVESGYGFEATTNSLTVQAGASVTNDAPTVFLGSVVGQVTDGTGAPIAGIPMRVSGANSANQGLIDIEATDGEGHYAVLGLPAGPYFVAVGNNGGMDEKLVMIDASLAPQTVNFTLAGTLVRGQVVAGDGTTPQAYASVTLATNGQLVATAMADSLGIYRFHVLAPGSFQVQAGADSGISPPSPVTVTTNPLVVGPTLALGTLQVTGTVATSQGGAPTIATVALVPSGGPTAPISFVTSTTPDGWFFIGGLCPGQYTALIQAPGFAQLAQTLNVATNMTQTFVLAPEQPVQGTITDADTRLAISNAVVCFVDPVLHLVMARAATDSSGAYTVAGLGATNYNVLISEPGHQITKLSGVSVGPSSATLNATLSASAGLLQGTVTDTSGEPLGGVALSFVDSGGDVLTSVTTAFDGTWSTSQLPPGTCWLTVLALNYGPVPTQMLTFTGGAPQTLNLALSAVATDDENIFAGEDVWYNLGIGIANALSKVPCVEPLTPQRYPPVPAECTCAYNATLDLYKNVIRMENQMWDAYLKAEIAYRTGSAVSGSDQAVIALQTAKMMGAAIAAIIGPGVAGELQAAGTLLQGTYGVAQAGKVGADLYLAGKSALDAYTAGNPGQAAAQFTEAMAKAGWSGDSLAALAATLQGGTRGPALNGNLNVLLSAVDLAAAAIKAYKNWQDSLSACQKAELDYESASRAYLAAWIAYASAMGTANAHCDTCGEHPPKPPKPPNPTHVATIWVYSVHSRDPNDKLTAGFGTSSYVGLRAPISYIILFENQPTASAPAQTVSITDALDANLDWSTLQLSTIGFNNVTIPVPSGVQSFSTNVTAATDPNPVQVNAAFDPASGVITWTMTSIDPVTGQLVTDPLAGFLPPDNTNGVGQGYIAYTVWPKTGLANATVITNQASVVFDVNAPILTPAVSNTIDSVPPSSSVNALALVALGTNVGVSWSGSDAGGSGIASYDIFVSANGGPWTGWLAATTNTSAVFVGANSNTYSFYSLATDNVGNVETKTPHAEATTIVNLNAPSLSLFTGANGQLGLVLRGQPAYVYAIEQSGSLSSPPQWSLWQQLALTNTTVTLQVTPTGPIRFYRARLVGPASP
ncbi:MAG: carboxypeptidase regulatory-like domain-containing protein, partial [Verrucomicrobiota bacterium]